MSDEDLPVVTVKEATPNPEETICEAARNDYMSEFVGDKDFEDIMSGIEGETIEEKKQTLIEHLLKSGHFGPFEHPQITFEIKGLSRSCMAQLTRHRHASFDVQSQRYVDFSGMEAGDLVIRPPTVDNARAGGRDPDKKSIDTLLEEHGVDSQEELEELRASEFEEAIETSLEKYNRLRDLGMPPEDARFVLPIGSRVNLVVSVNMRMLLHIADMRAAANAQWEVRELTEQILAEAEDWCPHTMNYYNEEMKARKNRLAP